MASACMVWRSAESRRWMRVRHGFHTIAVAALGVAYALYGWPRSRSNDSSHCEAAAWLSRLLLIMLAVMINGALY